MKLLVLGGTIFLGRHVVEQALERGHDVTLFHRGVHGADLFPQVSKLRGDRSSDLAALETGRWDVVLDTSGFDPDDVAASARVLRDRVDHYVFVSTVSVYRDWPAATVDEGSPTLAGSARRDYGASKARCERAVEDAMPGRVLVVRPALIVGPYENIGRLPYWLRRVAAYQDVLAPGHPTRAIQLLDARDLARWMLTASEKQVGGVFNAAGDTDSTIGELLTLCLEATGSEATLTWVSDSDLLAAAIEPWSQLPLWAPDDDEFRGVYDVDSRRSHQLGLTPRSLGTTVHDTWPWLRDAEEWELIGYRDHQMVSTLDRDKEQALLAARST